MKTKQELKTLKDLEEDGWIKEHKLGRKYKRFDERTLKAEAIKWVKNMRELPDARYIFRKFFNLTEKDLK